MGDKRKEIFMMNNDDYRDYNYYNDSSRNQQPSKKRKFAKRVAGITAAALLFGTVSGGVMAGFDILSNTVISAQKRAEIQQTQDTDLQSTGIQGSVVTTSAVSDVSGIVEGAMPSVVAINDKMTIQQQTFFGPQTLETESSGSGIIVGENDTELLIATNNHVVDGAGSMTVTFVDDKAVDAAIKGTDAATDLAIIAVSLDQIPADTMSRIKVASLGDSDSLKVGQQVIAIGNALGYGQSVTVGYISALNREVKDDNGNSNSYIQTDAAINPGNSGGALLDINGNVIGINSAKTASTEVEGMGYAIPISKANEILSTLMTKKTRIQVDEEKQGWLGIEGTNIDAQISQMYGMPTGIYVFRIVENGGAAGSGLKEKDIITKLDGQSVVNMEQLQSLLSSYESGEKLTLTVQTLESGTYQEHDVEITLGGKPTSES